MGLKGIKIGGAHNGGDPFGFSLNQSKKRVPFKERHTREHIKALVKMTNE